MMRPSRRLVIPGALLLVLAAAPRVWSELAPDRRDPCADPTALREIGAIAGSEPGGERLEALGPQRIQWSEGTLLDADGQPTSLRYHVIRSFDGRGFYVRPFAAAAGSLEPERQTRHRVPTSSGPIEVHRAVDGAGRFTRGAERTASWTFLHGNEPVASPVLARAFHAAESLRSGQVPITMLLVTGPVPVQRRTALLERVDRWLADAVEYHLRVCAEQDRGR